MFPKTIVIGLTALAGLAVCGCSSSGGSDPEDTTAPTITGRSIQNGETDVGLIERIDITFSEPMDPATIVFPNIHVAGRAPVGHVEYDAASRTGSFIPDTLYSAEASHVLVITANVADADGNALSGPDTTEFETGPFDCDHLDDYFEPNGSTTAATPIVLDHTHHTLATCGDDEDFYSFTLAEPTRITARTAISHADSIAWQLQFMRRDEETYATHGTTARTGETADLQFSFNPGTYYLKLFSSDDEDMVLHDLTLETSAPCPDDAYEDNDFRDEATPVALGTTESLRGCYLDADWYSFDLAAGDSLDVTITADAYEGNQTKSFHLIDPDGDPIGAFITHFNPVTFSFRTQGTGTHCLMIEYRGPDGATYDLDLAVTR